MFLAYDLCVSALCGPDVGSSLREDRDDPSPSKKRLTAEFSSESSHGYLHLTLSKRHAHSPPRTLPQRAARRSPPPVARKRLARPVTTLHNSKFTMMSDSTSI